MDSMPIGTIIVQSTADDAGMLAQGYLPMAGTRTYMKTAYPDLWARIQGTQWVSLDSGPLFGLRDLSNRFIRGSGELTGVPGQLQDDAAPNITGTLSIDNRNAGGRTHMD